MPDFNALNFLGGGVNEFESTDDFPASGDEGQVVRVGDALYVWDGEWVLAGRVLNIGGVPKAGRGIRRDTSGSKTLSAGEIDTTLNREGTATIRSSKGGDDTLEGTFTNWNGSSITQL